MEAASFSSTLNTQNGHLLFYFNLVYSGSVPVFHVHFVSRDRKVCSFNMQQTNGRWQLDRTKPHEDWLMAIEEKLHFQIANALVRRR